MSARKLRPTGKRVLVAPMEQAEKTSGGIVLSTAWQQPSTQGTVVAVGSTVEELKVGDRVAYSWINGLEVEHDGKTMRLLPVASIVAILDQAEPGPNGGKGL